MTHRHLLVFASVAYAFALAAACAASNDTSSGAGAGGSSATGGGGTTTTTTGSAGGFATSSAGGSSAGGGGGCVGTSSKADPIPLDIFIMLNQSGSMSQDAGNGMSRWETIQSALTKFVQQPSADGIGLGIQYFGLPQPSVPGCQTHSCTTDDDCLNNTMGCTMCLPQGLCEGPYDPDVDSCDAIDYAWADVAIQPLPGVGDAIISSIASHTPGTNTPSLPALSGAIDYASAWATQHPTHVTVVAFATDGGPSECDTNLNDIDAVAAAGFAATPSIQTFVIGVGPLLQALDDVAAAGGTTKAFHVDVNPMATQEFLGALNTIRGVALQCTYQIPPPPMGMTVDFGSVNVRFDPGGGKPAQTFPKVADKAHCPPNGDDAWYFDNNTAPTEIILCKSSCSKIGDLTTGELDVVLGCLTIVK